MSDLYDRLHDLEVARTIEELPRLIKKLSDARDIADRLGVTLGNGGEVGGLIGSMVDELEIRLDEHMGELKEGTKR